MRDGHAGKLAAQREVAAEAGRDDEIGWVDKHFAAMGLEPDGNDPGPEQARAAQAADEEQPRREPPKGRSAPSARQVKAGAARGPGKASGKG
jgi:hypothetical protein